MSVHMLDVGQGDSTFIELPDGTTMLIDAGEKPYGQTVIDYLEKKNCNKIDYLVGTHPHSDHIGGLAQVIKHFDIGAVYLPKKAHTTTTYIDLLAAVKDKGLGVQSARADKNIARGDGFSVDILSPVSEDYGDNLNLYSVVVKITHGDKTFLFMGDAETENERELEDVSADLIRVGHHGSNTSSGNEFVSRVDAEIAVVSVGEGNSYNLPKQDILNRWTDSGAKLYRTDQLGTVVARCDGNTITVEADGTVTESVGQTQEKEEISTAVTFLLNTSTKKIHLPDCGSLKLMSEKNKATTQKTMDELINEGYTACSNCQPRGEKP